MSTGLGAPPKTAADGSPRAAPRSAPQDAAADLPQTSLFSSEFRSVRLKTLAALRWVALAGQTIAVLVAEFWLSVDLPIRSYIAIIAVTALVNLVSALSRWRHHRLSEPAAVALLFFDLCQLSTLLYLAGGLNNPFALFLLGPVTISAASLTLRSTIGLGAVSIAAATVLSQFYRPLVFEDGTQFQAFVLGAGFQLSDLYMLGFWIAITLGVGFQAIYSRRVAVEAYNLSVALNATQLALERERQLAALGALSAAAAHELGTPLATIKLAAGELKRELADRPDLAPDLAEDVALISAQAERCRQILAGLAANRVVDEGPISAAPVTALVEEAAEPHRDRGVALVFRLEGTPFDALSARGAPRPPVTQRRPEIIQGLRNLIQNAVDFAQSTVWIDVSVASGGLTATIRDDGPGFSPEILSRLGEPFSTTRARGGGESYHGLGLGVFIAKNLLERTGAELSFGNAGDPAAGRERGAGAVVRVAWPRGGPR